MHDTSTGERLMDVEPVSGSWESKLNGVASGSAVFQLGGTVDVVPYRALFNVSDWSRTIVTCWNGRPVADGVIKKTDWDMDTDQITVSYDSYRTMLSRRTTFGSDGYTGHQANNYFMFTDQSGRSLANNLVWVAQQGPRAGYDLRISYGTRSESGPFDRDYRDYNGVVVEEAMQELTDSEGGPDVELRPVLSGRDVLSWELRAGNPRLSHGRVDFHLGDQHALTGIKRSRDAGRLASQVYVLGPGQERKKLWAEASRSASMGLDVIESMTDQDRQKALQQRANSLLATYRTGVEQWSMSLIASASPGLSSVYLGTVLRVFFPSGRLVSGWREFRVIGMSGSVSTDSVALTVEVV
ncbi:hypothetical protein [Mycetocola reblochoni]|uniref:hypothetical protein n=1 Tax=Mycetocola reblochoni TaxID=331618 RepID=UPI0015FFF82C|nr:hypothetical protein [Mycetocola reblochoni]